VEPGSIPTTSHRPSTRDFPPVNYPALLAPSRLAAVGHSLRAGLYRTDIVPRAPVHGRGPASSYRPPVGRGLSGPPSTRPVDCPADLITGVLALYPNSGDGSRTRSRSSFPSIGCVGIAPQEPVYWWLLPTPTCARPAVPQGTFRMGLRCAQRASSPPYSLRSLRTEAPRYRMLKPQTRSNRWIRNRVRGGATGTIPADWTYRICSSRPTTRPSHGSSST
jgi:hypothetical protein